jgi:hypothetical protein
MPSQASMQTFNLKGNAVGVHREANNPQFRFAALGVNERLHKPNSVGVSHILKQILFRRNANERYIFYSWIYFSCRWKSRETLTEFSRFLFALAPNSASLHWGLLASRGAPTEQS